MADARALHAELDAVIRPPAKAGTDPRAAWDARARSKLRAMIDFAIAHGWSWRALARELRCTVRHLQDTYDGKRRVPAWMLEGLPEETHEQAIRVWIEQLRRAG
jgi:hypothetical protein